MQTSALPTDDKASEVSKSLRYIHPLPAEQEKKHSAMKPMLSLHVKTKQASKQINQLTIIKVPEYLKMRKHASGTPYT